MWSVCVCVVCVSAHLAEDDFGLRRVAHRHLQRRRRERQARRRLLRADNNCKEVLAGGGVEAEEALVGRFPERLSVTHSPCDT